MVVLTADVFQLFIKSTSPWSRPHVVAQVTRNFGGVTTATYVIPVANLRLLIGETNRQGITSQYSIKFGLIGCYKRDATGFRFCCQFI